MNFFKKFYFLFFIFYFISCTYEGVGDTVSKNSEPIDVKSIIITLPSGTNIINKEIIFNTMSDVNKDISSSCKFFINDKEISGFKFTPIKEGEYLLYCTYNKVKSNTIKFSVIGDKNPIITITSTTTGVTNGSKTNDSSIVLKFTSSKSTSDFVVKDITVIGGNLNSFAGSGSTYTAAFTPTGAGAKTINIAANKFKDNEGNKNLASDQFNWTYEIGSSTKNFKTNVIVTDITGTWCQRCPRTAYKLAENEKKTSQLITVAVHGPLDFGDPFQYSKVNEYQSTFGVSGFPWALLNRKQKWDENYSAITSIADINSKVGLSIESSIEGTSLSVKVKVKFAEDLSSSNLKYVVLLLEDGLIADQSNWTGGDYGYGTASVLKDFVHDNVLRKALTSSWLGETITSSSTKIGNVFEKSFIYEIPSGYNKNKLEIVAMVVREDKSVINARHSDIGKTQSFEEM